MSSGTERAEVRSGWRAKATVAMASALLLWGSSAAAQSYPIVDTGQTSCYDTDGRTIACSARGRLSGQDGQHSGRQPRFRDNGDATVSDLNTGLIWQGSPGDKLTWPEAVAGAASVRTGGHSDWRLPDAKELQSIVDYSRAPDVTGSAAIDPVFTISRLSDWEYPYFWTSTTHMDGPPESRGSAAVYVAFGRALGYMEMPPFSGNLQLLDVHGAGAQRSDPKYGDPGDFPYGRGPQGDVIRIFNYVRCVRGE